MCDISVNGAFPQPIQPQCMINPWSVMMVDHVCIYWGARTIIRGRVDAMWFMGQCGHFEGVDPCADNARSDVKDACSEIFGKLIFMKMLNMITFSINLLSRVKEIANLYHVCK